MKWALWLGDPGIGFDGLVDTYEGAYYHQFGIYRPTTNSKMRTLGRPLNLPSVEGIVIEIYRIVNPIDDATPNDQPLNGTELVVVDPVDPVDHALDVQWYLDGEAIEGATQTTLDLLSLALSNGRYALQVNVVDNTDFVRDENARAEFMTDTRSWIVIVEPLSGDIDGDGTVGVKDLLILLGSWGPCVDCAFCVADLDGDCTVGVPDLLILLANWG